MRWGVLPLLLTGSFAWAGSDDAEATVGRVKVTRLDGGAESRIGSVSREVEARLPQTTRLLSLRPRPEEQGRFDATVYDDAAEQAFDLVLDGTGNELSRRPADAQPSRAPGELEEASRIVRESALLTELSKEYEGLQVYEPMPPITTDASGRRLVNVGIMSLYTPGEPVLFHEIVSVHLGSGEIVRYASGAPPQSRAALGVCGPATFFCSASVGPCNFYQVEWPAAQPVWRFKVRHPACTSSVQPDGTGIELTDVHHQDRLLLRRAEVPVLNVTYDGDSCGPFRDWLDQEDCFQAVGTDVPSTGSGIRVTSSMPATFCDSGSDVGDFRGVAIHDEGSALVLTTETQAGWYRYIMGWRMFLDGSIEPFFGYGATSDSCTCLAHHHHTYWRFDWALLGDTQPGPLAVERRRPGTASAYDTVGTEAEFVRTAPDDVIRILHARTGEAYILEPGPGDGSAAGDPFAKFDLAAVVARDTEIDDPVNVAAINIPWVNLEPLGQTDRVVTWYRGGFRHDDPTEHEACEITGPRLVPVPACESSLLLDRDVYPCGTSIAVALNDRDRCGANTLTVQATSTSEPAGETLTLVESPGGCGHFEAVLPTTTAPAAPGDGLLSITPADQVVVAYQDASFCGTPGVVLDKRATFDCSSPTVSNVQVDIGPATTTISWLTDEVATSVVHYGASIPVTAEATGGAGTEHTVVLQNLPPCSTWYFWVESMDTTGNGSGNETGGYYAFRRPRSATVTCTPLPPPPPPGTMTASRSDAAGNAIHLAWDPACSARNYHLAAGPLALVSSYATSTGVCGLGPFGVYAWSPVPAGNLWFTVVPDDGASTEGSWGQDGDGNHRNGSTALGWCGFTQRTNAATCP